MNAFSPKQNQRLKKEHTPKCRDLEPSPIFDSTGNKPLSTASVLWNCYKGPKSLHPQAPAPGRAHEESAGGNHHHWQYALSRWVQIVWQSHKAMWLPIGCHPFTKGVPVLKSVGTSAVKENVINTNKCKSFTVWLINYYCSQLSRHCGGSM